jgi:hypothetical protein
LIIARLGSFPPDRLFQKDAIAGPMGAACLFKTATG